MSSFEERKVAGRLSARHLLSSALLLFGQHASRLWSSSTAKLQYRTQGPALLLRLRGLLFASCPKARTPGPLGLSCGWWVEGGVLPVTSACVCGKFLRTASGSPGLPPNQRSQAQGMPKVRLDHRTPCHAGRAYGHGEDGPPQLRARFWCCCASSSSTG